MKVHLLVFLTNFRHTPTIFWGRIKPTALSAFKTK